jgi:predicted phosphohydrolase
MNIGVISDVHTEFCGWGIKFNQLNLGLLDVLCIAGDIYTKGRIEGLLTSLTTAFPKLNVVAVPGNHDYWDTYIEKEFTCATDRAFILNNEIVKIGDITFIGGTLWTDFRRADPLVMNDASIHMNDYKRIRANKGQGRLLSNHILLAHQATREFIFKELNKPGKKVVITHHKPIIEPGDLKDVSGYYYCSDLFDEIADLEYKPICWYYGHTHKSSYAEYAGVKFISNQLGYPFDPFEFDRDCCILDI